MRELHDQLANLVALPGETLPSLRWAGDSRWTVEDGNTTYTGLSFEDAVQKVLAHSVGRVVRS